MFVELKGDQRGWGRAVCFLVFLTPLHTIVSAPACTYGNPNGSIYWPIGSESAEEPWTLANQLGSLSLAFKRAVGMKRC